MPSPTSQFLELWRRLSTSQRATVLLAVVATLGLIGAIVFYGSRPDYAVLFSDLKPADAQSIVEKLKAAQVPYEISGDGTTISVPSEQVAEMRLQMAASGTLSSRHVGFDLFDKTSFGATDFTQQVNYQRALEGELARTLEGMKEVESARVHITRSRESVFTEKAEPAKASVMLALRGRDLSAERAEAVVSLVASAVEGLEPENVSVMDNHGRLLTAAAGRKAARGAAASDSLMEARRKFESESVEQIVALLEPVAGVGHVRANVSADIDFSQVEQLEETFDPKSAVVRTQQTSQEFRNSPGEKGGVVGTRANDPAAPAAVQTNGSPSGNGRSSSSLTYEISKVTKRTVGNGGRINRLSVSVLVDSNANSEGITVPDASKKIQELVSAALGIDTARGDKVAVHLIPFQQQPAPAAPKVGLLDRYRDIVKVGIRYGILAFVALLLVLLVIRPARRALKAAARDQERLLLSAAPDEPALMPASQEALQKETPRTVAQLQAEAAGKSQSEEIPRPVETQATIRKNHVIGFSKQEPEKVAMAVRNWLQEP